MQSGLVKRLRCLFPLYTLLSAGSLVLAFPNFDYSFLAWVALVPFLRALEGKTLLAALWRGYVHGLIFFGGTVFWLVHVTLPGAVLAVLYLASYFGVFAFGYAWLARRVSGPWLNLVLAPSLWVVMEFLRGWGPMGFDWVSLGHSQYRFIPFIQIADITGVAGVSFVVMMVNGFFVQLWKSRAKVSADEALAWSGVGVAVVLCAVMSYGWLRLAEPAHGQKLRVAVVQANIAQELKWRPRAWPSIMARYLALTEDAARVHPDLIIWPETAFPGYLGDEDSQGMFQKLQASVRKLDIPVLLGSITVRRERYYNSALLLDKSGEVFLRHDKLHLVPFGEYIPLRRYLPFLASIVPVEDFTPGRLMTIFPARLDGDEGEDKRYFSVLICFEDTLPGIARSLVRAGAQLLVNMTNDAWFQDTKAPFLHRQNAVFRAVENRRPLVRAANTGVSCFIAPTGKIAQTLTDGRGKATFVPGFAIHDVVLVGGASFYTKFGDVFTYFCFGCILPSIFFRDRRQKKM